MSNFKRIAFIIIVVLAASLRAQRLAADETLLAQAVPRTMPLKLDRVVPPTSCISAQTRILLSEQKYSQLLPRVVAQSKNASDVCKNRLLWTAARSAYALGKTEQALKHLASIRETNYSLRIWTRLLSAQWTQTSNPKAAATQASNLIFPWAGRDIAQAIITPPRAPAQVITPPKSEASDLEQNFAQALVFYNSAQYEKAQVLFTEIMDKAALGIDVWCEAALHDARSYFRLKNYQKSPSAFEPVISNCFDDDTQAWALYDSGRSYFQIGEWEAAIVTFDRLITQTKEHRLADDAMYRAALAEFELDRVSVAEERLARIPKEFPDGDMWQLALFRLAWDAYKSERYDKALDGFQSLAQMSGGENREDLGGQATYWLARTLEKQGQTSNAVATYIALCKHWPLRYYAQLSLGRLQSLDKSAAARVRAELRSDSDNGVLVVRYHPKYESAAFFRAIELLRVQERDLALAEFAWLGMTGGTASLQDRFIVNSYLQRAGFTENLDRSIRQYFLAMPGLAPSGANRELWELAYPKSFKPEIEKAAARVNIRPALLRAIAREESSFNPEAVSPARAYGLIQITLPTAQRMVNAGERKPNPENLTDPEYNLRLGARFVASLVGKLENPALVIAAYNAGEGAVSKWRSRFAGEDIDVFVEEIPYAETRQYTRRVLQSYGIYSWFSDQELPQFWSEKVK